MTFFELEKECRKRRIKAFLLFFLIFVFIVLFAIFILNFINMNKKHSEHKQNNIKTAVKTVKKTKKIENNKNVNNTLILKPIIDLNINDYKSDKETIKNKTKSKTPISENNKTKKLILSTSSLPSFETCILLAEKYYKNKDYENALKWAKNANIQNRSNPRSWIIVAKSLYKLNKKEKAVEILQIYYRYTKNKDILKLIERMKNGESF